MHQRVVDRMSLETHLRQAIEQRRLRTFFQPIVDLRTGALRGLEALARWPAGEHDIPPAQFIPVAEESGLDRPARLPGPARRLPDAQPTGARQGLVAPEVTVSVNVSVRQIMDGGLVDHVRAALADSGLRPQNLVLEITESTLIENPQLVSTVLQELLDLGVTVELDDFGTGYSSLTVLHDFPGHTLKIDRAFVDTMIDRPESETIVRSIVGLAHSLGLRVIAEGIEDTDQLDALTALGCEYGQGYHFSRPLPAADIAAMLAAPTAIRRADLTALRRRPPRGAAARPAAPRWAPRRARCGRSRRPRRRGRCRWQRADLAGDLVDRQPRVRAAAAVTRPAAPAPGASRHRCATARRTGRQLPGGEPEIADRVRQLGIRRVAAAHE